MSALREWTDWIERNPRGAMLALRAVDEVLARAAPLAATRGVKPLALFAGIPEADRALNDAFGIGEIAGRHGVPLSVLFEALVLLKDVALAVA